MKTRIAQIIALLLVAAMLFGATRQPGSVSASALATAVAQIAPQPAGPIDAQELEAFLDSLLAPEMAEQHVPGAAVAVVQDGDLLFSKGYGFADLDGEAPVDSEATLFHNASISKLFIWTAVMQLVEQGRLSLDSGVNEYLDFEIPATFPEPITIRHLMCHTAGFEDKSLGMWKLEADDIGPLGVYMEENVPARMFPAGEVISYSNYGASLAGYVVERVSGLPFSEYVAQNILAPLDMARSTFEQPVPEALAADLAKGYHFSNGRYTAGTPFDQSYPSGSLSATATDMARFMIAHLENGELEGRRILQEETARQMHNQMYAPDPRLDGVAHGFFEKTVNGQRIISHGGNYITFNSGLYLIPEQNVGFFITTNSTGGSAVVEAVIEAFLDHYYPAAETPEPQSVAGFAERIAPYLGPYTATRGNFTSFEKMNAIFMPVNAALDGDGNLELVGVGPGLHFAEVEPGLLQQVDEPANRLVYYTGSDGKRLLLGSVGIYEPFMLFRTPWYATSSLHLLLFVGGSMLFLGAIVAWPIQFVVRRRKRLPDAQLAPLPARLAHWAAALFGLLLMMSMAGYGSLFADIVPGFGVPRIWFETPPILNMLLALSYVLAALALTMVVLAVIAWVRRYWSLAGRIFYTLLALVALLLTWAFLYWNLL